MDKQYLDVSSKQIMSLELALAVASIYASTKTDDRISKGALYVNAAYMALGAYFNSEGRVKVLKKK